MVVKTRDEAWKMANAMFPTDYELDIASSDVAGYPIWRSTAKDNDSWISDLGITLELNLQEDNRIRTIRINITREPVIQETLKWSSSDIRSLCMDKDWYTAGDVQSYSKMLDYVDVTTPTVKAIYKVAKDIFEHTGNTDYTIENIMFEIGNYVVKRLYTIQTSQ